MWGGLSQFSQVGTTIKKKRTDSVGKTRQGEVILSELENFEQVFDAQIQEPFDQDMQNDRAARKEKSDAPSSTNSSFVIFKRK